MYFLLLLMALSTPSQAAPSCSDLEREWRRTYTRDINIHWDLNGFLCPGDESTLALAFYDLEFIELEPNSDGYKPPFYRWVKNAVKDIHYNKECTYLASAAGSHITVCKPFFTQNRENAAATLIHEIRHLESSDPGHADCRGGRNDGQKKACDEKFYDGKWQGSGFNTDMYFFSWVMNAGRGNELSKSVTQSNINAILPDRFNVITAEQIRKWRK